MSNAEKLKLATEKLWADAVSTAIKDAWLESAAIRAIDTTTPTATTTKHKRVNIENVAPWYNSSQVGIPWVNVNVPSWQPIAQFNQQEAVNNIETSDQAANQLANQIKGEINDTTSAQADLVAQWATRTAEDEKFVWERIDKIEDNAEARKALQEEYSAKLEESESRVRERLLEREDRDRASLEEQKVAEIEKLDRARELQAAKDKEAILAAEKQIEISRQQSAWAYQKLWLAFSSGIINTSQQIATDGAAQIAWLKVLANYNQADIAYKASQIEFQYTAEINKMIDKYTDDQLTLEASVRDRIYSEQENRLKDDAEKEEAIMLLERELIETTRAREDDIRKETERLRDKVIERSVQLKAELRQEEEYNKMEIDRLVTTGLWAWLSGEEKIKRAKAAWLSPEEVDRISSGSIWSWAINYSQEILGKDFMFSVNELSKIKETANYYLWMWYTIDEATNIASGIVLQNNSRYKSLQNLRQLQETADAKWLSLKYTPEGSSTPKAFQPKKTDLFMDVDGIVKAVYPDWIARPIYEEDTRTQLEQISSPKPWTPAVKVPVTRTGLFPLRDVIWVWTSRPEEDGKTSDIERDIEDVRNALNK